MKAQLVRGAVAGAVGTLALNVSTYLDVAARGRAPSSVPDDMVGKIAEQAGMDLAREGPQSERAQNRRTGLGVLSGYATGIGVGIVYGVLRPYLHRVPGPLGGLAVGAAAMATTDTGATALGVTNPRTWGIAGWLADIVPHAVYGLVTAAAFDRLRPV